MEAISFYVGTRSYNSGVEMECMLQLDGFSLGLSVQKVNL